MGQLDEAIRAHLELKRKHGASDEELQAEEQEALGPVRREPPAEPLARPPEADEGTHRRFDPAESDEPMYEFEPPYAHDELPPDLYGEPLEDGAPLEGEAPFEDEGPLEDGEPEDVLEETPDFLQETPEHDRLWFEQKPPRDFDFDDE